MLRVYVLEQALVEWLSLWVGACCLEEALFLEHKSKCSIIQWYMHIYIYIYVLHIPVYCNADFVPCIVEQIFIPVCALCLMVSL